MLEDDSWNIEAVGHTDLNGHGDCMHVNVQGDYAYVAHMGGDRIGTSVVDVSDAAHPAVVAQLETPPGTHSHKVQVADDVLVVNHERNPAEPDAQEWSAGLAFFDISDPRKPREVGFFPTPGKGTHRMTYDPPYVYMSGSDRGYSDQFLIIADASDPARPVEVGRWWFPGMRTGAGEEPSWNAGRRYAHHHANLRGDRAYATWWDAGLVILDISDVSAPQLVSHLPFDPAESGATHSALPLPGRDLLVVTDESVDDGCAGIFPKHVRVVDISDEQNPTVLSTFPVPAGDFCGRGGRFGPHNVHEMRPGTYRSPNRVHLTYFNAGLRVIDVSDPAAPAEVGYYVPRPAPGATAIQLNDLTVTEDGLVFVTDRSGGGLYILRDEFA
ncbi:hypothetical protein CFP66_37650 [Pseudonocardia sp. MH-G8]|nr:hypothetical protein CFP66_37650 [Pseudonocardia sp. MH-G8]